jgi:hypothetical protein
MPALSVNSTCLKKLRLMRAININILDSVQGTTGNPILIQYKVQQETQYYLLVNQEM